MSEQAAHPIWSCDDEAIKAEYQRALDKADKWQRLHSSTDSEAERLSYERDSLKAERDEAREVLAAVGSELVAAREWTDRAVEQIREAFAVLNDPSWNDTTARTQARQMLKGSYVSAALSHTSEEGEAGRTELVDVPPSPVTDEEIAALPVLDLDEFHGSAPSDKAPGRPAECPTCHSTDPEIPLLVEAIGRWKRHKVVCPDPWHTPPDPGEER